MLLIVHKRLSCGFLGISGSGTRLQAKFQFRGMNITRKRFTAGRKKMVFRFLFQKFGTTNDRFQGWG